jgi:hypothetical protein
VSFSLGCRAEQWNAVARLADNPFYSTRSAHWQRLSCGTIGDVTGSEFKVLVAISARTVRFRKFAEAISLDQFCNGLRNDEGDLIVDEKGDPYFAGCNISKPDTVSTALQGLEYQGLITRWPRPSTRCATVYMPFTEQWLATTLASNGGLLPMDYENIVEQEYIKDGDGQLLRVERVLSDCAVVVPIGNYLEPDNQRAFALPRAEALACARPTPAEFLEAKAGNRRSPDFRRRDTQLSGSVTRS